MVNTVSFGNHIHREKTACVENWFLTALQVERVERVQRKRLRITKDNLYYQYKTSNINH